MLPEGQSRDESQPKDDEFASPSEQPRTGGGDQPVEQPLASKVPTPQQKAKAPSGVSEGSDTNMPWPSTPEDAARGAAYIVSGTIISVGAAEEVTQEKMADNVWVVAHREVAVFQPDGVIAMTWNTTGEWGGAKEAESLTSIAFYGGIVQLIGDDGFPSDLYGDAVDGAGEPPPHFAAGQRVVAFLTMHPSPSPAVTDEWSLTYRITTLFGFDGTQAVLTDKTTVKVADLMAFAEAELQKGRAAFLQVGQE